MIGIPLGFAIANASEWLMHKYVLHGRGRRRGSFWSFHWHEHHKEARRAEMFDPNYQRSVFGLHGQGKEALALVVTGVLHAPLFPVAPFYVGTLYYCAFNYYRKHKRAHQDPAWAREHLTWHYDHHMAPNQHANWCVTRPWFDYVMGTRVRYGGTEREAQDLAKAAAAKARASSRAAAAAGIAEMVAPSPQAQVIAHSPRLRVVAGGAGA